MALFFEYLQKTTNGLIVFIILFLRYTSKIAGTFIGFTVIKLPIFLHDAFLILPLGSLLCVPEENRNKLYKQKYNTIDPNLTA